VSSRLHRESIVVDCLNGSALTPRVIRALRDGGVTAINLTAVQIGADWDGARRDLKAVRETIERHPGELLLVRSPDDIVRAKATDRTGVILGMQDAEPIGRHLDKLATLRESGVRIIQLTHNKRNEVGTGCCELDDGLTPFGRRVVDEMNRLGITIDVSHCGPRTTMDAIELSAVPVICSHANPLAICQSPRNKSDEVVRRLAARGGLIGIAFWTPILYRGNGRQPTIDDALDCFDYALKLVGPDHVAIGSDLCEEALPSREAWARIYGPDGNYPAVTGGLGEWYGYDTVIARGLETASLLPGLAPALLSRGHGDATISKILGANFQRLYLATAR
jgi:membrane dipeptidase